MSPDIILILSSQTLISKHCQMLSCLLTLTVHYLNCRPSDIDSWRLFYAVPKGFLWPCVLSSCHLIPSYDLHHFSVIRPDFKTNEQWMIIIRDFTDYQQSFWRHVLSKRRSVSSHHPCNSFRVTTSIILIRNFDGGVWCFIWWLLNKCGSWYCSFMSCIFLMCLIDRIILQCRNIPLG
jgi:hypothetical protein